MNANLIGLCSILIVQISQGNGNPLSTAELQRKNGLVYLEANTSEIIQKLTEGEQIALEVTNQLLPAPALSKQIDSELKLIRYKYRAVSKITHQRRWVAGELITTKITEEQIRQLNNSVEYGPLVEVLTIDLLPFYIATTLTFNKPYNPLALGERLKFQFGFASSPNSIYYEGNDIFYDLSTKTYIFKQKLCRAATIDPNLEDNANSEDGDCLEKTHYWEFIVSEEGNVKLIKEYDIDADGHKRIDSKYAAV